MSKNNNYVKRMLLAYLPILFLTVSVLIFIFFSIMNQLNLRNAIQANRLTAEYVANMVDASLKGISLDAQKMIETNGELQQFLDVPSDRSKEFDVSNLLSSLMVRYGLIDSIYLYRAKDDKILDQSAIRPLEQFDDRGYIRTFQTKGLTGVWSLPRLKDVKELGTVASVRVTSLGIKIPRDSGSLGYLIINIKVSSLASFIGQMIDRKITEAQLFDSQGKPFFGDNSTSSSKNSLSAEVISDYTGWKYRMSIKGGKLFDILLHGNTVWVVLAIGAIVFAIGSTLYVTRRSYQPIEAILHRINRFTTGLKTTEGRPNKNEFDFIDQAIERLIANNMAYQEKQQEHSIIRRQQFLQMLLKGEFADDPASWEQERSHFGLAAGHFVVALLELDNYVQFCLKYNPKDQSLFKFIISSVTTEVAEQNGLTCVAEWISKHQLVILLISNESESLEHRMLQMSEQIRSWIEKHLDFTVTIGIGTAVDQESRISHSFHDAMAAVSRKVTLGLNQIIDSVEVKGKPGGVWFDCLEIIRTIVRGLRMSDPIWKQDMKRFFHEMTALGLGKEDVDRILHYFIFHLEYELDGALPEVKDWMQEAKPELLLALEQSDTLAQLEAGFQGTLERLAGRIEELLLSRRHNVLMREVRDYAAKHFRDPNLSLTMLSDRFQINPKYLSQLFKESIGQNFSDFLIELRIEYAKKLLAESDVPVQDISEMIGYANPPSFNRAFKKIVGMSPSQYRETQGKDQPR